MSSLLRLCLTFCVLAPTLGHAAVLENPTHGSFYSGIGVISGWKCEATGPLTVRFFDEDMTPLGGTIPLAYRNERPDTAGVCGDTNNGFVAIWNWGNLGDGTYTAIVFDNGVEFARSTFTVTTPGEDFLTGAQARVTVENFPSPGETTVLEWNQSTQHFEIVEVDLIEAPLASYDRAYWREVGQDLAAGTYATDDFLYASLPDLDACQPGTLSQEAKERALEAMNQIRALHGIADVQYSFQYDTSVQESALIQAANSYLTHSPDPADQCYTEAGAAGSASSNLYSGFGDDRGVDPVAHMMGWTSDADNIADVQGAGHRRWLLNPFATYMSYGQVYSAAAQKVSGFDREPDITPQVEVDYIAFPYETYPFFLMSDDIPQFHGRHWNFSDDPPWGFSIVEDKTRSYGNWHPYFESATVSVTRVSDGTSLTVPDAFIYTETGGAGVPNLLSWYVEAWEFDTLYQVEIDNVTPRNGGTRSYSYPVFIDRANIEY